HRPYTFPLDLVTCTPAQHLGGEFPRPLPEPTPEVTLIDAQLLPLSIASTDKEMRMALPGVAVFDGHPLHLATKIRLDLFGHEPPHIWHHLQVFLGRDDHFEKMPIPLPLPLSQCCADPHGLMVSVKTDPTPRALHALTLEIGTVFVPISAACTSRLHHGRLHQHALLAWMVGQPQHPCPTATHAQRRGARRKETATATQ